MSDLEHWTSDGATEAEAKLLAAARGGGPSSAGRARIAGALGIAASMGSVAPAAAKAPLSLAKWIAGKWVMIGALGTMGAVGAVGAWAVQRTGSPSMVAPALSARPANVERSPEPAKLAPDAGALSPPRADGARADLDEAPPSPAPSVAVPTSAARSVSHEPPATTPSTVAPVSSSSVDAELALLESAKESLDRHRPDAALATVTDYQRRHPHGLLAIEANVIRIEALAQARRVQEARSAANAFLRSYPNAVQAARVRTLLREIDASP